jgi:phosphatidylserine decarboxylase
VPAFRDDAAEVNTSELSVICNAHGDRIGVRQVVGLVARRIVCYLREEEAVERGELMGLIKFGSRVDLLIPSGWEILVKEGDRMRGGETPVARRVAAEAGNS